MNNHQLISLTQVGLDGAVAENRIRRPHFSQALRRITKSGIPTNVPCVPRLHEEAGACTKRHPCWQESGQELAQGNKRALRWAASAVSKPPIPSGPKQRWARWLPRRHSECATVVHFGVEIPIPAGRYVESSGTVEEH